MRKIFIAIAAIALAAMKVAAATFSFTSAESVSQTADGYTVTIAKGNGNNAPAYYDNGLRLYANNTITISGPDLTGISLTFSMQGQKAYADLKASVGTLVSGGVSTAQTDLKTDEWTGNANSVTFTLGASGQRLINRIVVNGDGSEDKPGEGGDPEVPVGPDTPPVLDPDYNYAEPTGVSIPDFTVQGDEYSFVSSNIEVSCTKGAITSGYFSAHAGYALTFTAAKPIKGIVINGFVKSGFTATVDHGRISYLTPEEDSEANPVVVITDVDSESVRIDCVKQLRCYSVEVYFDANPEVTVSGGLGTGEEITLSFDSAEAVYESEYSEMIEEENYSIFLFNAASPEVPYFALDIFPASKDDITGTYLWDDLTLGDFTYYIWSFDEADFAWMEEGNVTITKTGDIYTVEGILYGDNTNIYNISFTGEMPIYLDKDYYGDGDSAVDAVLSDSSVSHTAYDLQGRRVGPSYRGIIIRNGQKIIAR